MSVIGWTLRRDRTHGWFPQPPVVLGLVAAVPDAVQRQKTLVDDAATPFLL